MRLLKYSPTKQTTAKLHYQNMLSNQELAPSTFVDMDSLVHKEVVEGLAAAKQYESQRPRLSPEAQQLLMNEAFPYLSSDDEESPELSSTKKMASPQKSSADASTQSISKKIAILQEQLTEYHSVIEKLESMTAQFQLMQQQNESLVHSLRQRDEKINSLEQKLIEAKINQELTSCAPIQVPPSNQTTQGYDGLHVNAQNQFPTFSFSADASDHYVSTSVNNCFIPSYTNYYDGNKDLQVVSHSSSSTDLTSEDAFLSPELSPVPLSGRKRILLDDHVPTRSYRQRQSLQRSSNNTMNNYTIHQLDQHIVNTSFRQYYGLSTNEYGQLFCDSQKRSCFRNQQK